MCGQVFGIKEIAVGSQKRNQALDFAKGLAILLMIYDHIVGTGKFITSFHMPLFFIISGYLMKEGSIKETIVKKARGLLLPYVKYNILAVLVGGAKCKFYEKNNWHETGTYIVEKFINIFWAKDIWLLWFLLVLFEATIIYIVIRRFSPNGFVHWILVGLIFSFGYILSQKYGQDTPYYIDQGMFAVLFIAVGDSAKKLGIDQMERKRCLLYIAIAVVIWGLGIHYGLFVMALRIFDGFPLCVLAAIAGTAVVIYASDFWRRIPVIGAYVVWCGQKTLELMCLANLFRQFTDWQKVCNGIEIYHISIMFMLQTALITIIVILWDRFKLWLRMKR